MSADDYLPAYVVRYDGPSTGKMILVTEDVAEVIGYLGKTLPTLAFGAVIEIEMAHSTSSSDA